MSNKPQAPLNSPEVTTKDSTVTPSTVVVDNQSTHSVADTTTNRKSLIAQAFTDVQSGLNKFLFDSDDEFDPLFPIVAATSEFTVEAAEEGIRARHDSGYVFEGTHAEFNRHIKESIKLFKHA